MIRKTFNLLLIIGFVYLSYKTINRIFYYEKPTIKEISVMDLSEKYFKDKKKRFLQTFEKDNSNPNENIDQKLYDKEWYLHDVPDNEIEKIWKTKVLVESTPQGNVIMYYDIYKNGFAYYCNSTLMDYFLNAIAMKYVLIFKCRDFFMDEKLSPVASPLIKLIQEAEKEKDKKINPSSHRDIYKNNEVFVKKGEVNKKNKTTTTYNNKKNNFQSIFNSLFNTIKNEKEKEKEKEKPEVILHKNKFIRLGNFNDFSFLQKSKKKSVFAVSNSLEESEKKFSYSDYKKKIVVNKFYNENEKNCSDEDLKYFEDNHKKTLFSDDFFGDNPTDWFPVTKSFSPLLSEKNPLCGICGI